MGVAGFGTRASRGRFILVLLHKRAVVLQANRRAVARGALCCQLVNSIRSNHERQPRERGPHDCAVERPHRDKTRTDNSSD